MGAKEPAFRQSQTGMGRGSSGNLGGQGQEELVDTGSRQEVGHQMGPTLDQDPGIPHATFHLREEGAGRDPGTGSQRQEAHL